MMSIRIGILRLALGASLAVLATAPIASAGAAQPPASVRRQPPGGPLSRSDTTPFASSKYIVAAKWTSGRFDPPANQSGDILPTVWSSDGATYVMMDDGGVDVPVPGGLWRQSLARITGSPPRLRFQRVGDAFSPVPRTWTQIGTNWDNDDGPLGPYYSIGFVEANGTFYATQQRNWNWSTNGPFSGLAGIAYSKDRGKTWHSSKEPFPAPLGNLSFIDAGARGGAYPDGYVYAIGTEREFNASRLLLGRVRPGIANLTDPARWQWFAGSRTGSDGKRSPQWSGALSSAAPVLEWSSHLTYPQITYDPPLHRYLLSFTYSYSSQPPAVWKGGAELVIMEAPTPAGPFSFVARSREFGPSNGYGASFPSQWISRDGRDLWLKWAANFAGCAKGLDCSGKYGFNVAKVHLTLAGDATRSARRATHIRVVYVVSGASLPLFLALLAGRRRAFAIRSALRRQGNRD
jgi:hypothetical protein